MTHVIDEIWRAIVCVVCVLSAGSKTAKYGSWCSTTPIVFLHLSPWTSELREVCGSNKVCGHHSIRLDNLRRLHNLSPRVALKPELEPSLEKRLGPEVLTRSDIGFGA
jgi:hypothetical protein